MFLQMIVYVTFRQKFPHVRLFNKCFHYILEPLDNESILRNLISLFLLIHLLILKKLFITVGDCHETYLGLPSLSGMNKRGNFYKYQEQGLEPLILLAGKIILSAGTFQSNPIKHTLHLCLISYSIFLIFFHLLIAFELLYTL